MPPSAIAQHPLDQISLGKIVQIRERLLKAQAAGKRVYRSSRAIRASRVAPHVLEAITRPARAGKTHYIPNNGIPELRTRARARRSRAKNGIAGVTADDIFVTNGAMHALYVAFGALLDAGRRGDHPRSDVDRGRREHPPGRRRAGRRAAARRPTDSSTDPADDRGGDHAAHARDLPQHAAQPDRRGALASDAAAHRSTIARAHDLWIVSDEAYEDVIYAPHKHHSIGVARPATYAEHVVSIFSFSKSHAMSGLRIGYIVTRVAAAARPPAEAAALHDQRREQPRAVGARSPRSPATQTHLPRCATSTSCVATLMLAALDGDRRACVRSRRAAPSTSGPSSTRRSTSGSASRTPTTLSDAARGDGHRQRAGRRVRRARATTRSASPSAARHAMVREGAPRRCKSALSDRDVLARGVSRRDDAAARRARRVRHRLARPGDVARAGARRSCRRAARRRRAAGRAPGDVRRPASRWSREHAGEPLDGRHVGAPRARSRREHERLHVARRRRDARAPGRRGACRERRAAVRSARASSRRSYRKQKLFAYAASTSTTQPATSR